LYTNGGSYGNSLFFVADTDGDGVIEDSGQEDYRYAESENFDADQQMLAKNTDLWDIPTKYHQQTNSMEYLNGGLSSSGLFFAADTDGDGVIEESGQEDYRYSESKTYDPNIGFESMSTDLWDIPNKFHQTTSSYSYANGSGISQSSSFIAADTDGDGVIEESGQDDYRKSESQSFNPSNQTLVSSTDLWDIPNRYHLSTDSFEVLNGGTSNSNLFYAADTDGDGVIEESGQEDYRYSENKGFDAGNQYTYASTELWDIPNKFYYATTSWSFKNGDNSNGWTYAADVDGDDNIEIVYRGDDAYESFSTGFWASQQETYTQSYKSIDGNNNQGAYMWSESVQYSRPNGWFANRVEMADLSGWSRSINGRVLDSEDGPLNYQRDYVAVWGQYYADNGSWTYDAGDFGTSSARYDDTDGNSDWDNFNYSPTNTQDLRDANAGLYEIEALAWNEMNGSANDVGYEVENEDTGSYDLRETSTSPNGDTFYEEKTDGVTGNYYEMYLAYNSGSTTPYYGTLYWDPAGPEIYEYIWHDGGFAPLPRNGII
jgi:hypothetical protein